VRLLSIAATLILARWCRLIVLLHTLRARYPARHLFLLDASWGHSAALSYLTLIDGWQENQPRINGYIYREPRGRRAIQNLEAEHRGGRAKPRLGGSKRCLLAVGPGALPSKTEGVDPAEFLPHDEHATRAMGVSYPM